MRQMAAELAGGEESGFVNGIHHDEGSFLKKEPAMRETHVPR